MSNLLEKRRRRDFGDGSTEAEDQTSSHELKGGLASRHENDANECDSTSEPDGWTSTKAIADPVTDKRGDRRRQEQGGRDETKPVASRMTEVTTGDGQDDKPLQYYSTSVWQRTLARLEQLEGRSKEMHRLRTRQKRSSARGVDKTYSRGNTRRSTGPCNASRSCEDRGHATRSPQHCLRT